MFDSKNVNIGVIGAAGKMGKEICKTILLTNGCNLSGALEGDNSEFIGTDIGILIGRSKLGIQVTKDTDEFFNNTDLVIDFSNPKSTLENLQNCKIRGKNFVSGTTGLDASAIDKMKIVSKTVAVLWSPNMSIGANIAINTVESISKSLSEDFDIEIIEHHHKYKKDLPSGTAIALGKAVARGLNKEFDNISNLGRSPSNPLRKNGEIGFSSTRGGDSSGEHTVIFAGDGERIEIKHISTNRAIFAKGAVKSALWLHSKKVGFYSMKDVVL